MVVVPFDPDLDLIYVDVTITGPRRDRVFLFALDTACGQTLVTPDAVDDIGYSARAGESITTVTTALGKERGFQLQVSRLQALGHAFDDWRVHVHDLPDDCGIDGLLGLDFLRRFNYEIRSAEGRILVAPVASATPT